MPAIYHVDTESRYILSTWEGDASDDECIAAMQHYMDKIRGQPESRDFHEMVNFSKVGSIRLTARGLITLAQLASETDRADNHTKLAIVVTSGLAFSFARTYAKYRQIIQNSNKEIRVFRNDNDALEWITAQA